MSEYPAMFYPIFSIEHNCRPGPNPGAMLDVAIIAVAFALRL